MKTETLLNALFPKGHRSDVVDHVITGYGDTDAGEICVIGAAEGETLSMARIDRIGEHLLEALCEKPGIPILTLVDHKGHKLGRQEETLGLNAALAHLLKAAYLARTRGHRLLTLVHGSAWAGGFLSLGMCSDRVYALKSADIGVMKVNAMSKVTKQPLEKLLKLGETSPIFAPGPENFHRLGGVHEIWDDADNLAERLVAALRAPLDGRDDRSELGLQRGGRAMSQSVIERVMSAAVS